MKIKYWIPYESSARESDDFGAVSKLVQARQARQENYRADDLP